MATKKTEAKKPADKPADKSLANRPKDQPLAQRPQGTKLAGKGFENLEREDLLIPRLKLLQPMSPEVTGELEQQVGTIFQNLSQENYGKEIVITPILHFRSRIKWFPKPPPGKQPKPGEEGIDCSAPDGRAPKETKYAQSCSVCPKKDWTKGTGGEEDAQPECTMYENFVVLVGDSDEPVVLSMERTKQKVAKKFYSMMALKGGDMFDHTYKVGTVKETSKTDTKLVYYNYTVAATGKKTPEELRAKCDRIWDSLSKATIVVKDQERGDEAAPQPAQEAAAGKY